MFCFFADDYDDDVRTSLHFTNIFSKLKKVWYSRISSRYNNRIVFSSTCTSKTWWLTEKSCEELSALRFLVSECMCVFVRSCMYVCSSVLPPVPVYWQQPPTSSHFCDKRKSGRHPRSMQGKVLGACYCLRHRCFASVTAPIV